MAASIFCRSSAPSRRSRFCAEDFTIDPYQICARYYRADACLLMLSVLDDDSYRQLAAVA